MTAAMRVEYEWADELVCDSLSHASLSRREPVRGTGTTRHGCEDLTDEANAAEGQTIGDLSKTLASEGDAGEKEESQKTSRGKHRGGKFFYKECNDDRSKVTQENQSKPAKPKE